MATFGETPGLKCRPHPPHALRLIRHRSRSSQEHVIPEGITRSRAFRPNVARPPATDNTSIQRPLARHRVMLSRRVIAYYGLIRASGFLPATYGFVARAAAPKENRLKVGIQRVPNLLRWTVLACRLPYPGGPKSANDCYSLFGVSLHRLVTGSATTLV